MFKTTLYIFRQLFFVTGFVTLVLTGAVWLTQALRFVDIVVNKGLPMTTFFSLVVFLFPDLFGTVLPAGFIISLLFLYNRLIADQELVVMRSLGMSNWQLAKPALTVGIFLTLVMYGINLYILPRAFSQLRETEHEIKNMISHSIFQVGEFNTIKDLMIFVRAQISPNEIAGIILHDAKKAGNSNVPLTITAERAAIVKGKDQLNLILFNGIRHGMDPKTGVPSMLFFDQYSVNLLEHVIAEPRFKKPYEHGISELLNPESIVSSPQLQAKFKAQGHQRLISPLYILTFGMIGLGGMLSGELNRRFRSRRVVFSVGFCAILQILIMTLLNFSEQFFFLLPLGYILLILANIFSSLLLLGNWKKFASLDSKEVRP